MSWSFGGFIDLFELFWFFFLGGMIVHRTSLMTKKTSKNLLACLNLFRIFFYPCSIKKYTYRLKYIHEHSLKYFSAEGSMRSLNLKKTGVFSFLLVIMIEYN